MNSSELALGLITKNPTVWDPGEPNSVTRSLCKASADNRKWNERPNAEGGVNQSGGYRIARTRRALPAAYPRYAKILWRE
jgi:hypothetical protein